MVSLPLSVEWTVTNLLESTSAGGWPQMEFSHEILKPFDESFTQLLLYMAGKELAGPVWRYLPASHTVQGEISLPQPRYRRAAEVSLTQCSAI